MRIADEYVDGTGREGLLGKYGLKRRHELSPGYCGHIFARRALGLLKDALQGLR